MKDMYFQLLFQGRMWQEMYLFCLFKELPWRSKDKGVHGAITVTINELIAGYTPGFKLVYGSETTGCIAWDGLGKSDVVSVEARLEALSGITNISTVTKSSISSPENGFAYTIVFSNPSAPTSLSVPLQASVTDCDAMPMVQTMRMS